MKIAVFSTKTYDRTFFEAANAAHGHALVFFEARLTPETSALAATFPAVCVFVNDQVDATVLSALARQGGRVIALRRAGFNNVDLAMAHDLGLTVVRVPAYAPVAVAEHTSSGTWGSTSMKRKRICSSRICPRRSFRMTSSPAS